MQKLNDNGGLKPNAQLFKMELNQLHECIKYTSKGIQLKGLLIQDQEIDYSVPVAFQVLTSLRSTEYRTSPRSPRECPLFSSDHIQSRTGKSCISL